MIVASPEAPRNFKELAEKFRNGFSFRGTLSYDESNCIYSFKLGGAVSHASDITAFHISCGVNLRPLMSFFFGPL